MLTKSKITQTKRGCYKEITRLKNTWMKEICWLA